MTNNSDFEITKLSWKKGESPFVAGTDVAEGDFNTSLNISVMGFVSREKPQFIFPTQIEELVLESALRNNDTKVKVLRSSLFFYAGQETYLKNIREFFTEKAIVVLEKDGYIKIY